MKSKLFLLFAIITILNSCSNPKSTAINLLDDFSDDLKKIENPEKLSIYELDKQLSKAIEELNKNRDEELAELTKEEDIKLFENFFKISNVKEYNNLVNILTNKNIKVLEQIKGKYWIETKTSHSNSIFTIDNNYFKFLNLRDNFSYQILNGSIVCDNQKVFLKIKSGHLFVFDENGNQQEYKEATKNDLIVAKWGNENTKYLTGFSLKKEGKGERFGYDFGKYKYITYKFSGNKIVTYRKHLIWDNIDIDKVTLTYINANRIKHEFGASYYRIKSKGPNSISYLTSSDYDNPIKKKIKVRYSNITSTSKHGSKNWDKLLDDYEDYVDEYIKFYKKAQNGNTSAISEYTDMLKKAENLQRSLESAKNDNSLSISQIQRLNKIQMKILNEIQ